MSAAVQLGRAPGEPDGPVCAVQLKTGPQVVVKEEAREVRRVLNDAVDEGTAFVSFQGLNGDHIFFPVADVAVGSDAKVEKPSDLVVPQVGLPGLPGNPMR